MFIYFLFGTLDTHCDVLPSEILLAPLGLILLAFMYSLVIYSLPTSPLRP